MDELPSFAFYRECPTSNGCFIQFEALLGEVQIRLMMYKGWMVGDIVDRIWRGPKKW